MTPKPRLIIPDTDVIIDLHKLGVWDAFVKAYQVHIAEYVLTDEALFYVAKRTRLSSEPEDYYEEKRPIDLSNEIESGEVIIVDPSASEMYRIEAEAKRFAAPDIDDGEKHTIAVVQSDNSGLVACLKDKAAIEYAGLIGLAERCISIEAALSKCGLTKHLSGSQTDEVFKRIMTTAMSKRVMNLCP
jgi:hypothetical protein